MRYLEKNELIDGEIYFAQTYDGHLVSCYFIEEFEDRPFELEVDRNISFNWDQIRYVFDTKTNIRKIYE